MIERIIVGLRRAGFDPSAVEVADLLWLAAQLAPRANNFSKERPPTGDAADDLGASDYLDITETGTPRISTDATKLPRAVYRFAGEEELGTTILQRATSAWIPGGRALPGALDVCRALRPLRKRVSALQEEEMDELATAHRIAETSLWLPVLRPARERWLSLALVVDSSPSMKLWLSTVKELKQLMLTQGAFREIQGWVLDTGRVDGPSLIAAPGKTARPAKELLDPAGRRLIMIVTDCVAPAWYGARMKEVLQGWARRQPVGVLSLLPQRLWRRTGLVNASIVHLRSVVPPATSARRMASPGGVRESASGRPIPITTLEPDSVSRKPEILDAWARLVAGVAGARGRGMLLYSDDDVGDAIAVNRIAAPERHRDVSAEERLRTFRTNASPLAYHLACLFSTVPLSLPVMRLVQHVLLPESRQSHLAEVILGGLLRRVGQDSSDSESDRVFYDFYPGVREILQSGVDVADAAWVKRLISRYVSSRYGRTVSFRALVADSTGKEAIPPGEEPFAAFYGPLLGRLPRYRSISREKKTLRTESQGATQRDVSDDHWRDKGRIFQPAKVPSSREYSSHNGSFLCLSCWRIVSLLDAYYQCPICQYNPDPFPRGDEGPHPVRDLKRSFWRRLTGEPPLLMCKWHPETQYRFYCECGSELSRSMRLKDDRPLGVGVVGSTASGKTTLLVTMIDGINRQTDTPVGLLGLRDTEERFAAFSRPLLHEHRPLDATSRTESDRAHFAWEVLERQRPRLARSARLLAVHDVPGETWETLAGEDSEKLNRYLSRLGSLALILDGATVASDLGIEPHETWLDRLRPGDHGAVDRIVLRQLIERLDAKAARRMRVALVVSKLDLIWDNEYYRALRLSADSSLPQGEEHEQLVQDMISRSGRNQLILAAEKHFGEVREFAVSSFGFRPTISAAGEELSLDRPIQPQGVVDLLLWLLNLRGIG